MIGLQEVRSDDDGHRTQLTELQELLPDYKWTAYKPIQRVTLQKGAPQGWEWEGWLKWAVALKIHSCMVQTK